MRESSRYLAFELMKSRGDEIINKSDDEVMDAIRKDLMRDLGIGGNRQKANDVSDVVDWCYSMGREITRLSAAAGKNTLLFDSIMNVVSPSELQDILESNPTLLMTLTDLRRQVGQTGAGLAGILSGVNN